MPSAITAASEAGERSHQEDRYLTGRLKLPNGKIYEVMAVMDGHGGDEASELVSCQLLQVLEEAANSGITADMPGLITRAIESLDRQTRYLSAGTTLSMVLVPETGNRAYAAVIGDSPIVILDRGEKINISPEHNVRTNPAEFEAALSRGAHFDGAYILDPASHAGLQMSRALGDRSLDAILSRTPDVYSIELGAKSYIIVGSDGLFDPVHYGVEEQITRLAQMVDQGATAKDLVRDAIARRTQDNATAVVWRHS